MKTEPGRADSNPSPSREQVAARELEDSLEDAAAADELIGCEVGNFRIVRLLAAGGMGAVYVAENPKIGRQVAVKVLARYLAQLPRAGRRFLSEARAAARIHHPNVIDIHDFGETADGVPYQVMELLDGEPLRVMIQRREKVSAAEAFPFVQQICAGLQAAHDEGVVHRDLKPDNIHIVSEQPLHLKILDFGIAKLLQDRRGAVDTTSGLVVGTPLVISPEQAAGHPDRIGYHTDIYSLGVILFWLLTGRPPFNNDAPGILISMHLNTQPPSPSDLEPSLPPGVAGVVLRCLEKEPHHRPRSAAEVARAYEAALGGDAHPLGPSPVEEKRLVKPRWPLWIGLLVLLLLGGGAAALFGGAPEPIPAEPPAPAAAAPAPKPAASVEPAPAPAPAAALPPDQGPPPAAPVVATRRPAASAGARKKPRRVRPPRRKAARITAPAEPDEPAAPGATPPAAKPAPAPAPAPSPEDKPRVVGEGTINPFGQ